jgi:endo-1,4-beta-D-glucanase Y
MKRHRTRQTVVSASALVLSAAACSVNPTESTLGVESQAIVVNPPSVGAAVSGTYRNLFVEWLGVSHAAVDAKIDLLFNHYFGSGSTSTLYNADGSNANGPKAYIWDTGNRDVRSEGMSYGMMIAVQLGKKAEFDAIWNWAKSNMQYQGGKWDGYFAWNCNRRGVHLGDAPASDGEEYFATALFFASHRWGDGSGIYAYSAEANRILNTMLHKEDMNGGVVDGVTNMFDETYQQVVFTPYYSSAEHTDPSYHLPAFYELWGRWAEGYSFSGGVPTAAERDLDRQFWLDAAAASRSFFGLTTHPVTGLNPDYAYFTGEPHPDYQGNPEHMDFRYDAWRTAMNWAVDYSWWAADENEKALSNRLLTFFYAQGIASYGNLYTLDGTALSTTHSLGLVSTNGAAALAATDAPSAHADEFVAALWNTEPQFGNYRYYDGMLQVLSFLHVSGKFRAIFPGSSCAPSETACSGGQDDDCDGSIDCADTDCAASPACDVCGNGSCGSGETVCTCSSDCGSPPASELSCNDNLDNDCDGAKDCVDADCASSPSCQSSCLPNQAACTQSSHCCSNNCRQGKCKGG